MKSSDESFSLRPANFIVGVYACVAGLWIVFSDHVLGSITRDAERLVQYGVVKGILFVGVTSAILYGLVGRMLAKLNDSRRSLRESEERLRYALQGANDGIWDFDFKTKRMYHSPRWKSMLGYSEQELNLEGPSEWTNLIHPLDREGALKRAEDFLKQSHSTHYESEFRMRHKGGHYVDILSRAHLVTDDLGNPLRLVGTHADMSERNAHLREIERLSGLYAVLSQASRAVTRAESEHELFKQICQITSRFGRFKFVMVARLDRDDSSSLEPLAISGETADFGGHFAVGRSARVPPDFPSRMAIAQGKVVIVQNPDTLAPGVMSAAALPIRDDGRIFGSFTVFSDEIGVFRDHEIDLLEEVVREISYCLDHLRQSRRQKLIEEQLRQSQKMEAVGQLAGGLAHDFNNLLQAIGGNAQLQTMLNEKAQIGHRHLDQILKATERGAALIQSMLVFARKKSMSFKPIDLNCTVQDITELLARLVPKSIALETDFTPTELMIHGDQAILQQLVFNLVNNARDAIEGAGHIRLTTERVRVSSSLLRECGATGDEGDYVVLTAADTGQGMSDEVKARLFEPFFTTKAPGKGTGLGLAMVYGAVKEHRGFIQVRSNPGKGTEFRVYLPLLETAGAQPHASRIQKPALPGKGQTILVVDDEELVRILVVEVVKRYGYSPLEAASGPEAIEKLKAHPTRVDLVILDFLMPQWNGMETLKRLRELQPDLPYLFLTGLAPKEGMEETVGAEHLLTKPVRPDDLVSRIAKRMTN